MSYFSNLAIDYPIYPWDPSYTPPEIGLLWRLEALQDRLHELVTQKTGNRDEGVCFSGENLRYVLPKDFFSASDVRKAIDLAIDDLAERYSIYVRGKPVEELPVMDEITEMQISFLDILSVQACRKRLQAA